MHSVLWYNTSMKTTEDCIKYLSTHPWLSKGFNKLKQSEKILLADFLDLKFSDKSAAFTASNRMFMDKIDKPKNHLIISELISCALSFRFS